jgi:hypothetical protein
MGLSASGGRAPRRIPLKTIIRNARVLTMDAADTEYPTATVHVEDGVITAVEPETVREALFVSGQQTAFARSTQPATC